MEHLLTIFAQILPPALALSFAAYLISFFGNINDQKPFADSRKWDIELSGLTFSIELLWTGILAYGLATIWNFWVPNHFWDLAITGVIGALLFIANKSKGEEIYQIKLPDPITFHTEDTKRFFAAYARIFNSYVPSWPFAFVSLYILIGVFHQGNLWWFSAVAVQVFLNLIFLAINYSFRRTELPKVDIHFIDHKKDSLLGVLLIKVTDDSIRVRSGDTIFLVNRNQVLRIEIPVDKKWLPEVK